MKKVTDQQVLRGFPAHCTAVSDEPSGRKYTVDTNLFHSIADRIDELEAEAIRLKAKLYDFEFSAQPGRESND